MNPLCLLLAVLPLCMIHVTYCQTDTLSCNFEAGLCGYFNVGTVDWVLENDGTPSTNTGPEFDHTLGTTAGNFLYMEATDVDTGANARLISPLYMPSAGVQCFEFWYHMYGDTMGTFNFFLDNGTSLTNLFSETGDQGDVWKVHKYTIPAGSTPLRFEFEAVRGDDFRSDISIDDLLLLPHSCDPCDSGPCLNGGTCLHDPTGSAAVFMCSCTLFYIGTLCETELNSCIPNQCLNGGTCTRSSTDPAVFTCTCQIGFTGTLCGIVVDACVDLTPCLNGATCITNPADPTLYTCVCPIGFTGQNCGIVVDACVDLTPCLNGATCITNPADPTLYTCICPIGFTGQNCGIVVDACVDLAPCLNRATCITDSVDPTLYTCICPIGFTDPICSTVVDACVDLAPCLNGATCLTNPVDPTLYSCICSIGFTGPTCSIVVDACVDLNPCLNGATCITNPVEPTLYTCICPNTFVDPICSTEVKACDGSPCQNGGTCSLVPSDPTLFNCTCAKGYTGQVCDRDLCYSGYVVRFGRCVPCPKGTYKNNALGDVTCKRCPPRYITTKIASRSILYCKYCLLCQFDGRTCIRPGIHQTMIPCSGPLDLIIAIDVSNPFQLGLVQFWISALIKGFQIGPDNVRIGLLRFSDQVDCIIPLHFGTSIARINLKIRQKLNPLPATVVNTARALEAVFVELKAHHRPLVPSTALIITSHISSLNSTSAVGSILKAHGVYVTAIGTSQVEVESIAFSPQSQFLITGYEALPPRPEVLQSICG